MALHKGGMQMTFGDPWYCGGPSNYSRSWTVAHDLRYHWGNVNGQGANRAYQYLVLGTAGYLKSNSPAWNDLYRRCSAGDIIQYVNASDGRIFCKSKDRSRPKP